MNVITLFNELYLLRGLALLEGLRAHQGAHHLAVLAMSRATEEVLRRLDLRGLTIVSLSDFETPDLLVVKPSRSYAEYCWTCTPSAILYALEKLGWDHAIYLDADLFFYHDPSPVVRSWLESPDDIFLTDHWYTPRYDQSAKSGRFCVQFLGFKKTPNAVGALRWWADRCLEWCYARHEGGKFGDQKYLDDWPEQFSGVRVNADRGLGVAPWNVQQYRLEEGYRIRHVPTGYRGPLYFFHFHGLAWESEERVWAGSYALSPVIKEKLYRPYVEQLARWEKRLRALGFSLPLRNFLPKKSWWRRSAARLKHRLLGTANWFEYRI